MPTARVRRGRAEGAKSTIFGKRGRRSGPAASARIKRSGFFAAKARKGSRLLSEIPASCAAESKPLWATFDKSPELSTPCRRFLTFTLFPTESTWEPGRAAACRVKNALERGCDTGAKALAEAAKRAAEPSKEKYLLITTQKSFVFIPIYYLITLHQHRKNSDKQRGYIYYVRRV
jgi:hypothetical protein